MAIKHLTPQSKWKIFYNHIKDFIIAIFSKKKKFSDIPIFQNVIGRSVGFDLVSVEPMKGPTGQIFYLDYRYINDTSVNEIKKT